MTPYAELGYFALVLAVVLPMMVAGARGRAGWVWILGATLFFLPLQYTTALEIVPGLVVWELAAVAVFGLYLFLLAQAALRKWLPRKSLIVIPLGLLPLALAKYAPLVVPGFHFGFAGISYVTFRALDVLWCITDGVLAEVGMLDFLVFLFFFPTVSSGPIDRFRRFQKEWRAPRSAEKFWQDLDAGTHLVFLGLLYKFVLATVIDRQLVDHVRKVPGVLGAIEYAYAYSALLFFDFAGYSAFAVGVSRWFGIHAPPNFHQPFAAVNIRDFWNRWHMSLSFWFRDHVYTRFLLAAVKGKWFKKRETAGRLGYFVSFGCMGVWHGLAWYYLVYGFYHAVLFNVFDAFTHWKKKDPRRFAAPQWKWVARFVTVHCVIFGFWIFSGHGIVTKPLPEKRRAPEVDAPAGK